MKKLVVGTEGQDAVRKKEKDGFCFPSFNAQIFW